MPLFPCRLCSLVDGTSGTASLSQLSIPSNHGLRQRECRLFSPSFVSLASMTRNKISTSILRWVVIASLLSALAQTFSYSFPHSKLEDDICFVLHFKLCQFLIKDMVYTRQDVTALSQSAEPREKDRNLAFTEIHWEKIENIEDTGSSDKREALC